MKWGYSPENQALFVHEAILVRCDLIAYDDENYYAFRKDVTKFKLVAQINKKYNIILGTALEDFGCQYVSIEEMGPLKAEVPGYA